MRPSAARRLPQHSQRQRKAASSCCSGRSISAVQLCTLLLLLLELVGPLGPLLHTFLGDSQVLTWMLSECEELPSSFALLAQLPADAAAVEAETPSSRQ
ncbi:hypothetical protein cyc_02386 [Cyclospora cayetanensis]|uniref:Uncharacterized protein n=1 Tax=Cyclospora cayetanensis TaxID=88456 RepID=A0A1D3D8M9_9EIME|nr:hypothetical protein cyc_02386 [Cyclospora cayetanensis]